MRSLLFLISFCLLPTFVNAQTDREQSVKGSLVTAESTKNKEKFFGGFGLQLYGYTPDIERFFSFYNVLGKSWNAGKKLSYGYSVEPFKVNWTRLNAARYADGYDKARYFSVSSVFSAGPRFIFSQKENYEYKAFELGGAYSLPLYYNLKRKRTEDKMLVQYPNWFQDFHVYSRFFYNVFILKFEYHPFDIIQSSGLPEPAKFNIGLEWGWVEI